MRRSGLHDVVRKPKTIDEVEQYREVFDIGPTVPQPVHALLIVAIRLSKSNRAAVLHSVHQAELVVCPVR